MDTIEALMTRRSIRQYTAAPVPDALVEEILRAAMAAPSAANAQPWQFVIFTDRALIEELAAIHPAGGMLKDAALGILICGDLAREVYAGFWVQDCSAAVENLLLAAHARGLGAVWIGIYPMESGVSVIRKRFGLPDSIIPLALVPIGWPAEELPGEDRYDPARVHRNGW